MPITRFLFDQMRTEANTWWVGCQNKLLPSRRQVLRRLREARGVYVNVACGPLPLPEFVNLDLYSLVQGVIRWDCRWSLPVSDEAAAGIRVEHFYEHLEAREEAPHFLRDCHRALRPGGILRIIVPDSGRFLQAYSQGDRDAAFSKLGFPQPFPDDLPTAMDVINHVFHQWHEHRWGYDTENLTDRLRAAGFATAREMSFCCSLDPHLAHDAPQHAPYSLYMDAVK
jgi:predicted SAM-dependent methyltransferase